MTLICGRYLLSFLLLLSVTQTATGLWWRDLLFNDYLRPALERLVSHRLDAEVRLARLTLTTTRLRITGLSINKRDMYRIVVANAEARFTLTGLWHRQLEAVRLQSPRIETFGVPLPDSETPMVFPERPPLEIAHLSISDGSVTLPLAGARRELHELEIDLFGTLQPHFKASARLGAKPGLPISLAGEGNWDKRPGITLSRFNWDGISLLDTPLRFQLDSAGAMVAGNARLPQLNRPEMERIAAILDLPIELPTTFAFAVKTPELSLGVHPTGFDIQLAIPEATVQNGKKKLEFEAFMLTVRKKDSVWEIEGRFTLEQTAQTTFSAQYDDMVLTGDFSCIVADIGALAGRFVPARRQDLTGGGMLAGQFSSRAGEITLNASFTGRPSPNVKTNYRLNIAPIRVRMTANSNKGKLEGRAKVLLAGRTLAQLTATPKHLWMRLEPISLTEIQRLTGPATIPDTIRTVQGISGSGQFFLEEDGHWRGQAELTVKEIKAKSVETTGLTVNAWFSKRQRGLELNDLRFAGHIVLPEKGSGQLTGMASGALADETLELNLNTLNLDRVEVFSEDGLNGLTGGRLHARGTLTGYPAEQRFDFALSSRLAASEILLGSFYARLDDHQALMDIEGHADLTTRTLTTRHLILEIPEMVTAQLTGSATPETGAFDGALTTGNLGVAFARYLKNPLENSAPGLSDLQLDGFLSADFSVHKTAKNLTVKGALHPRDMGLTLASADMEITGLNGLLPLSYQTERPDDPRSDEMQPGQLTFASLKIGPAALENGPIRLLSSTNRLAIAEFPDGLIAGGKLRISELNAAIDQKQPTISARIRVEEIDLEKLTSALKWAPMTGEANADLGEIRYADRTLSSAGQATIDVFGGSLTVSNISMRDPTSRYRTLNGDIDFTGIDLHQLTRTFEFGEINGILDGHIHQLRLFGATPSHFDAELATRETGRRNISIKALNNLSILSQGGLSAALSRGIYRFIDFYRYQKIGLRCTLSNDVFRLQGTALPDSDEFLVHGGRLPPKIDIIAPRRDISFKEMLKRLGRLDRAGR